VKELGYVADNQLVMFRLVLDSLLDNNVNSSTAVKMQEQFNTMIDNVTTDAYNKGLEDGLKGVVK
jgi:hypothetical protein